jgi:hypothetical protein
MQASWGNEWRELDFWSMRLCAIVVHPKGWQRRYRSFQLGRSTGYRDDDPGNLWHVILYIDERANAIQKEILGDIFLGRAGGTPFKNYAGSISEVYSLRSARIELSHVKNKEYIRVGNIVSVRTDRPVESDAGVSCSIPGHGQPGQEVLAEYFRVKDGPFDWDFMGRCGFATRFSYKSN